MELLIAFLIAMSVTMALIPPLMQLAVRFQFLDAPNERKVHTSPVPRVGGIAMAAGMFLALGFAKSFAQPMPAFMCGVLVLLGFGVADDRFDLSPRVKFIGQIIAVLIVMFWGNVLIDSATFVERHSMPAWLSMPLTFFFLLGVTNAINLADGLDGLAGGTTLLSLGALALLALTSGVAFVGAVAIVISGAILGFLRFNTHPARVFMGDGGSQILGFAAAVLAVVLTQDHAAPLSAALPLLLLGIPIIDTLMVMTQRVCEGRSPFSADRNHIHHRLLARGFDHHEAVVAIYVLQGGLFVTAWFLRYESDLTILLVFAAFSFATIGSLQLASRHDWRWRRPSSTYDPASPLSRVVHSLRRPTRLPLWALLIVCATVAIYLIASTWTASVAKPDVRLMAAGLAIVLAAGLLLEWRRPEPSRWQRVALYVTAVMATYLNHLANMPAPWPTLYHALLGALIASVIVRFRLASDRRFRVSSLDVLVIFAAVIIPNLPGSVVNAAHLGDSIVALIALLYGIESVFGAGARWWRVISIAALVFLASAASGAF